MESKSVVIQNKKAINKSNSFIAEILKNKVIYAMMLPGILFMIIYYYLPMLGAVIAFEEFNPNLGIFKSPWIGFKNFEFLFKSDILLTATYNTVFYNVIFIVLGLGVSLIVAILLNEIQSKFFNKFYKSLMLFPYLLSWVVGGYLLFSLLSEDKGLVNQILVYLGKNPVQWYSEAAPWRYFIPISYLWKNIGYLSIIFLAGITGISPEYYEAAKIDGATKFKQMVKITIPLLMPIVITLFLLQAGKIFTGAFGDWGLFYNIPRESGVLFKTTNVIDTAVYRALKTQGDFGMSSAAGLYQSVVGFVMVIISNFIIRKYDKESALF